MKIAPVNVPRELLFFSPEQAKRKGLITIQDVADHFRIDDGTVLLWRKKFKDFPDWKARLETKGTSLLFSEREIAQWLDRAVATGRVYRIRRKERYGARTES